jgi:hypothetical protein
MKTFKQILKELATTDGGYKGPPKTPGANKKGGGGNNPLSHEQAVKALITHFEKMHGVRPDKISSSGEGPTRTTIISHSSMPHVEMSVNGGPIDPVLLHSIGGKHERLRAEETSVPGLFRVAPDLLHNHEMEKMNKQETADLEKLHSPNELAAKRHPDPLKGAVVLTHHPDHPESEYQIVHTTGHNFPVKASSHGEAKKIFDNYMDTLYRRYSGGR